MLSFLEGRDTNMTALYEASGIVGEGITSESQNSSRYKPCPDCTRIGYIGEHAFFAFLCPSIHKLTNDPLLFGLATRPPSGIAKRPPLNNFVLVPSHSPTVIYTHGTDAHKPSYDSQSKHIPDPTS